MKEITGFSIKVTESGSVCGQNVSSGKTIKDAITEAKEIAKTFKNPRYVISIKYHSDFSFRSIIKACQYLASKKAYNAVTV